jgi:hypothetical protein
VTVGVGEGVGLADVVGVVVDGELIGDFEPATGGREFALLVPPWNALQITRTSKPPTTVAINPAHRGCSETRFHQFSSDDERS